MGPGGAPIPVLRASQSWAGTALHPVPKDLHRLTVQGGSSAWHIPTLRPTSLYG